MLIASARANVFVGKSGLVKSVDLGKEVFLFTCGKTCFGIVVSNELSEELRNSGVDVKELKGKRISVKGLEKNDLLKVLKASDFEVVG